MAKNKKDERGKKRSGVKPKRVKKIVALPADPELKISKIQDFQLQVIAHTNFNNCDGVKIELLLRKNRLWWRTAMMIGTNLWSLRDMEEDRWLADTLYIFAREGYEDRLEKLVEGQFDADVVNWIGGSQAIETMGYWKAGIENNPKMILSVWWD
jgi:hypothetical protein